MPLKVVVELQIHAVTCPGVFLPDKNDIFLSVCLLCQCKETRCVPPVFPLLFHEKMRFEKVFQNQVDPAAVLEILEKYAAGFKLIQIGQSGEEVLSAYKENHRHFLFSEPKLTPPYPGVDREVLMKASHGFPGIAPKVEFSTRTTIKEKDFQKKNSSNKMSSPRSLPNSPSRKSRSPAKNYSNPPKSCNSPTRSFKYRSSSPFKWRRMCEFGKESQQCLAHLNMGSFEFKSNSDTKPPFIVRHVDLSKPVGEKTASQLQSPKFKCYSSVGNQIRRALTSDNLNCATFTEMDDLSLDDLYIPRKANSYVAKGPPLDDRLSSSTCSFDGLRTHSDLMQKFKERRRSDSNTWESIHNRVRGLLSTHSARELLSMDISNSEADCILERSRRSLNNSLQDKTF